MAYYFKVPNGYEGKSLVEITGLPEGFLKDSIPGVSPTQALKAGQGFSVTPLPGNDWIGSGGYATIRDKFTETTEAELYAENLTKALQEQINKETAWVSEYTDKNPFIFDEELARQSATAEYEPYYQELLSDYIQDVNLNRETVQDEQKLLGRLKELDTGAKSRAHAYAVENAEKGFAGKGLFSSGMRARTVGREDIEYKTDMEGTGAQYEAREGGIARTLEGYDIEEERKRRDIERSQKTAIEGGIEQRYGEQQKPYLNTYEQAYKRQFQPSTMSATDYLPSSYLRY